MWPLLHTIHPLLLMCMYVCFTSAGHEAFCSRVQVFRTPKRKQLGYSQINAINKVRRKSKNTQLQRREELCWVRYWGYWRGEERNREKGYGVVLSRLDHFPFKPQELFWELYVGSSLLWAFHFLEFQMPAHLHSFPTSIPTSLTYVQWWLSSILFRARIIYTVAF